MKLIVGSFGDTKKLRLIQELGIGRMWSHYTGDNLRPYKGECWGFDNGAFHAYKTGADFPSQQFKERLEKARDGGMGVPYLAVTPDLVANGDESLAYSMEWREYLPDDWPWYLAVQDDMRLDKVEAVVGEFDGLFLGGTLKFKRHTGHYWSELAHRCEKKFHYGRCSTPKYLRHAFRIGADSVDTTQILWDKRKWVKYIKLWQWLELEYQLELFGEVA